MNLWIAGIVGFASGVASGLFGVGGGVVMVPAMIFLMRMDPKTAIGTSLIVIIPTALMGSWKHYQLAHINWQAAISLIPLAFLGGFCGAWLTGPLPAEALKRAFGGFLVLVGFRLLFF